MRYLFISLLTTIVIACNAQSNTVHHYLYLSYGDLPKAMQLIKRPEIEGLQIIYNWNMLEKSKGRYDFSKIEEALSSLKPLHKRLFIQVQDRFFSPDARNVPSYLLNEPEYNGGIVAQKDNEGPNQPEGSGWVTQQWNPAVQKRFQLLIKALAAAFDGRVYGINLPETAADIDMKQDSTGFDCDKYFNAELENIEFTRKVFKKSYVVQFANFFPCEWGNDHQYMSRLFALAEKNNIGLGGPDIVPYQKGQMKNSYPFFHLYKGRLPLVAMAIQEPTLTYINPGTGKPFTKDEFVDFAENYLGVNIIFWSLEAPWLALK